jgi:hypothetical protein
MTLSDAVGLPPDCAGEERLPEPRCAPPPRTRSTVFPRLAVRVERLRGFMQRHYERLSTEGSESATAG